MSELLIQHKTVIAEVMKDFLQHSVLKNRDEVSLARDYIFKKKGLELPSFELVAQEEEFWLKRFNSFTSASLSPEELPDLSIEVVDRNYTERCRPHDFLDASRTHYTNAERNFVQNLLKILREKTTLDFSKQKNIAGVVRIFKQLYSKIFGNDPYRSDRAIEAFIRKEQKRLDYGFTSPRKSLCDDDIQDTKKIKNNLRKLVLRRVKLIENEEPFTPNPA